MPLVRIDLQSGQPAAYKRGIADVVYHALVEVMGAPQHDQFEIITEHDGADLIVDPQYLGIPRTDRAVIIQITLNEGRTVEMKKAFYAAVADGLHDHVGMRREDVIINLVETKKENWSFGNGEAQYT